MLPLGDLARYKKPQMPHMGVRQIDDPLTGPNQLIRVLVDKGDPAERLVRRRDVVAVGGEDHQRIADAAQVGETAVTDSEEPVLELIANEEVFDDR